MRFTLSYFSHTNQRRYENNRSSRCFGIWDCGRVDLCYWQNKATFTRILLDYKWIKSEWHNTYIFKQWWKYFEARKYYYLQVKRWSNEVRKNQESIPVGCVPSAAVAVGGGGVSAPVHAGICLPRGRGVCPSACWDTHPPVNRMTDPQVWLSLLNSHPENCRWEEYTCENVADGNYCGNDRKLQAWKKHMWQR